MTNLWVILVALLGGLPGGDDTAQLTDEQKAELSQYFGFGQFDVYKIKPGIGLMRLADLNKDGRTDVVLWNSHQSRIEVFYQPDPSDPKPSTAAAAAALERNEVPNRGNLRNENIPVAYRVAAMEVGEFTGDGRPDIVFFGEPKELVVVPSKPDGGFGPTTGVRAPEGEPRGGALAVGDFNGDKRDDVALIGAELILLYYGKPDGGFSKPSRIVHTIKQPLLMLRGDLNGDRKDDLVVGSDEDEYGVYAWLQEAGGLLGPMRRMKVPKLRSMTIAKGPKGDELFSIESVTGRLKHFMWDTPMAKAAGADWPQLFYTYPVKSQSKRRPIAFGDVTGDGKVDVIAVDPEAAQLILFEQGPGGLEPGTAYPGLVKTLDVAVADIDGDGKNEVLSVSGEEKMIGVSHFTDGRLTFPTAIKSTGEPQAVAVGSLKVGEPPRQLAYVSKEKGKASITIANAADGDVVRTWELESLDDEAAGLRFIDLNQDGLNDLVLFVRFNPLQAFVQKPDGSFEAFKGPQAREGLVKEASVEGYCLADVTGDGKPEFILAQKNLARAFVIRDGQWTVVDQYNPESADAQLSGVAAVPGQSGSPTLVFYDKKSRDLLVMERREDKTYAVSRTMPVGAFELTAMDAELIGADRKPAILMADAKSLLVLRPNEEAATLVEKHSYETAIKDAYLMDSVVGDLNGDGVRDLAVVDGRKANVEILTTLPSGDFVKALAFQVFQGKRFRDEPEARGEPREVLIGDVTGDKRDDLVIVVHDRLIVYPGQ